MSVQVELTNRDEAILQALTNRVRVLSIGQVARTFWDGSVHPGTAAKRRLARLEDAGLIEPMMLMAHPELLLSDPVVRWRPGDASPDLGQASYRLKARWTKSPIPTAVVVASERGGNAAGGIGGRRPRTSEGTHDLHVASVYLRLLRDSPSRARYWVSEGALARPMRGCGNKLPDALIASPSERTVVEFGGAYPKRKLEGFHAFWAKEQMAYEIW